MPKAKIARKSTAIDMTPMVDLAFLLITFFMLTIKFKAPESVQVLIPNSISTEKIPDRNVMTITISDNGRVFFGITDPPMRDRLLRRMADIYKVRFTEEEIKKFSLLPDVGVRVQELKQYLNVKPTEREKLNKSISGVPTDTTDNQLDKWVIEARRASGDKLALLIKADQKTPYPVVRQVVNTLKKQRVNRFNLITSQEADPRTAVAKPEE